MRHLLSAAARRGRGLVLGLGSGALLAACGVSGPEMVPADLPTDGTRILFIHHSVGKRIWEGGVANRIEAHNAEHGTAYHIVERSYPDKPHPWRNDPHDYWRLWVEAGDERFRDQATLAELAAAYDVVVFKHCYTAAEMVEPKGTPSVSDDRKSADVYRLQYEALKQRLHEFPDTQFVLWTMPPRVASHTDAAQAARADEFTEWVRSSWDEKGDNIHLWDFRAIAAENGMLPARYASGPEDSHPNATLAQEAAPLLARRIVDVIESRGDDGDITGRA